MTEAIDVPVARGSAPAGHGVAARLRGFGPPGIAAMLVVLAGNALFVPLSAILALVWARLSGTPWADIGYVRPRSWSRTVAIGLAFGAALKLVMKAVVMPLLGAPAINPAYHFLAGNRAALPAALYAMTVGAGFGEETMFRGYMFERLGKLLGRRPRAKTAIVILTTMWFAAEHYPAQGLAGVEQAAVTGAVFGTIFARTGRLGLPMIAHAAFDLTALAIIYWDVEAAVAHAIFR